MNEKLPIVHERKTYNHILSTPVDGIRVVACPLPFSTVRVERMLSPGGSISDILRLIGCEPTSAKDARVFIGDVLIRGEHYDRVKPKPGQTVTVRVVPRGGNGGKGFLRVIIGIVGAVAGAFTGGAGAAAIWGAGAAATGASIGGAIGGLAANLAANALIPPPKPKKPLNHGLENSPSVAGTGNYRSGPIISFPANRRTFQNPVSPLSTL